MYEGEMRKITKPLLLNHFSMRMYKVGEPQDSLVAYVYKLALREPVWIPLSDSFASRFLDGKDMTSHESGQMAHFQFSKPLALAPGLYRIVIYRTGKPDDKNFYRVYINNPKLTRSAIEATAVPMPLFETFESLIRKLSLQR